MSGKSWFTTEHQPDNPKRTAVIIIDLTGLADAIDIGDLPLLVPGDAELTQKLLKRAKPDPHPDEADIPVLPQSQASAPELDATTITPNASSAQEVSVPQAAEKPRAPAPSPQPQVASLPRSTPPPLPKSGRQRRQEEYDRREHQVQAALVESASPPTGPATRRSFAEEPLGDGEIVLPVYLEISEEIWQAIEDDDVRFLLALLNHTVKKGASSTNELLNAVVKAGRIDLNGDNGVHDPKKLPSIIKGLKNISRPKIVFDGNGGKPTITLTKEGEAYLATQYRKIQQKLHRTKEGPKVTSRARTKAA